MSSKTARIGGWKLFGLLAGLVLAMSALILALNPDPAEAMRSVIRATARSSFVLFLAAFVASSLATLVPNEFTRGLVRERRYIGLSFAFSHLVHLGAIFSYGALNPQFWPSRGGLTNLPGTVGYLAIALLTVTSFHAISKRLSPAAWKRLHTAGMWTIALIFGLSFYKRISTMGALYAIPFAALCAAVAVRWVGKWAQAGKRKQARLRSATQASIPMHWSHNHE